jgi:5-(carboxyamino)imidazole ribonucleotide synthase
MELTSPGPTLGVVGGGQLGRMLAEAAAPLGAEVVALDPTPDPPAAPVSRATIESDFDDPEGMDALAARADCLTYEIELADPDLLERVGEDAGVPVHPAPETLRTIQDKLVQKRRLREAGVPVPAFRAIESAADLEVALDELGCPVMLKARRGGYDGRGNVPVESPADAEAALGAVEGPAMVEEMVDFERELSVIGVRGAGEVATFTPSENVHREEILRETVVPARTSERVRERARAVAREVLDLLSGRGTFGIELFEIGEARSASGGSSGRRPREGGEILVNEIAPRPHNSGHWTIEGALTSQFEQHARAVLGWPLGATTRRGPTAIANVLGDVDEPRPAALSGVESALAAPGVSLHWYGKREARPLRKMGHLTAVGDRARATDDTGTDDSGADPETGTELLARVRELRDGLTFAAAGEDP